MLKIQDCVALVTGSNRGLGLAYCEGLLRAGAAKVYAAARDPSKVGIRDSRVVPLALDVTSVSDVISAALSCQDISLLVNNAGVLRDSPMLGTETEGAARQEMETNYFGVLSMVQRFAPVLARNGDPQIASRFESCALPSWTANEDLRSFLAGFLQSEFTDELSRAAPAFS
jgi:NAD(P)-dependent dehydrogenase (short-subunit alcohol dehydrogenase family)